MIFETVHMSILTWSQNESLAFLSQVFIVIRHAFWKTGYLCVLITLFWDENDFYLCLIKCNLDLLPYNIRYTVLIMTKKYDPSLSISSWI